ncbi:hypothetical protein LZ012_02755 [Dechloromonas sp. XY25]|uniref:5-formyltetrahydrofolate cyclo-ligase n=1 Tax=Dechloromonas hankyongensis TaxID=2908002 RepID=A0ABS9JYC4_9RHOO|nr:hypothetical protein [Dechloromonas hankyongensis]MCG2575911.1 hypothetical protein [Dechloromonas hankyongensis]
MNTLRRALILLGGAAAIPMSMGCITAAVMSGGDRETYTETVDSVLVSADGKTLAVLGKDYHYLFEAPPAIKLLLESDLREVVDASFHTFMVDANQHISGGYFLRLGKNASPEQKDKALAAGFKPQPSGGTLTYNGTLSGTRYAANGIQATAASQKLRKTYTITISAEKSAGSKAASTAGKLLLTPITLAADGVLILLAAPLLLIFVISSNH